MGRFDGRVAIATGAARGIGYGIAHRLASEGARVAVVDLDESAAKKAAAALPGADNPKTSHVGIGCDVSDTDSVQTAVDRVVAELGGVHILVNNAGITRDNLLMRMKPEEWESVIATNLNGLYYCSQAVLRPMIRERAGRIINMSSVVGLTGNPGQANYAASKAAILGFTKALAREVASRQITVNAIAPGYIETDMTREIPEDARKLLFSSIPMQRIGRPEDVASAALYLASEGAAYVTGQVLQVNGGLYM